MADKNQPETNPEDQIPEDPMAGIKPQLNRLPWERDPSVEEDEEYPVPTHAITREADETATRDPNGDASPAGQSPAVQGGITSDNASVTSPSDAPSRQPYQVGTRTFANPQTAIDSAASDKLFAMGVDEYEEDRSRFRVFFDVLFGKFWKLIGLNLQTGLFNLPALLFMGFFAIYYMQLLQSELFTVAAEEGGALAYLLIGYLPLGLIFLSVPVVAVGPAQAGMHYILRNYSYEIPVFQWSDFKEKMRENFKQGLAVTFINLFVFILAMLDIYMYPRMVAQMGVLLLVANYLLIVAFIVFLMMTMYIYPMMVRYELTLKNLYRNAFLLAVGRFFPNLLVLLITVVLAYGPFLLATALNNTIVFFVVYVYHLLLGLTLPGLVISYLVNPMMDKLMMPGEEEEGTSDQE